MADHPSQSSSTAADEDWLLKNQNYLMACIENVQAILERRLLAANESVGNRSIGEAIENDNLVETDGGEIGNVKSTTNDYSHGPNSDSLFAITHTVQGKHQDRKRVGYETDYSSSATITDENDNDNQNADEQLQEQDLHSYDRGEGQHQDSSKSQNISKYALDTLCHIFGLSDFETMVLLLCAGVELKSSIADLCAKANGQDHQNSKYATFEIALSIFENAHWSALSPSSPLRRFKLINLIEYANVPLVKSPIKIDETILNYLIGIKYVDKRLRSMLLRLSDNHNKILTLTPQSHQIIIEKILISSLDSKKNSRPSHEEEQEVDHDNHNIFADNIGEEEINNMRDKRLCNYSSCLIHLWGTDRLAKESIARSVSDKFGLHELYEIHIESLPVKSFTSSSDEIGSFVDLLCREVLLLRCGILISLTGQDSRISDADIALLRTVLTLVISNTSATTLPQPIFLNTTERLPTSLLPELNSFKMVSFEISKLEMLEQRQIWRDCLINSRAPLPTSSYSASSSSPPNDASDINNDNNNLPAFESLKTVITSDHDLWSITDSFDFNFTDIASAANMTFLFEKYSRLTQDIQGGFRSKAYSKKGQDKQSFLDSLWKACREQSTPNADSGHLAIKITPQSTLDDLVLPDYQMQLLRWIAMHVKHKSKVYGEWGFASQSNIGSRGLGLTALFEGESGTGKTMAAEALAKYLDLALFRIDLAFVVSKYIGETEKHLSQLFDAAERGGAILFFDEADTLFGKRSEVKDSHDRYANIEVGYLLQRLEQYRGLAILSTNMRTALDPAFVRRLKFIIKFPFPDEKSRKEIWHNVFPKPVSTSELDFGRLAKLNIAGGSIRNIALNASFMAAEYGEPVNMKYIKQAVRLEYEKMGKTLSPIENWE